MDKEIKFVITANSGQAETSMARVGKTAESMGKGVGKSSALGIAGMRGLEVVAADLGRSVGITGEAASVMGRSIGNAAQSIGKASLALGAVGIVAYAAYMVYDKLAGSAKRVDEETTRAADAAMKWIDAARDSTVETDALREAKERLWAAERAQTEKDLETGIALQEKTLASLSENIQKWQARAGMSESSQSLLGRLLLGNKAEREIELRQALLDYEKAIGQLHEMYAKQDILLGKGGGVSRKPGSKGPDEADIDAMNKEYALRREIEFEQRISDARAAFDKAEQAENERMLALRLKQIEEEKRAEEQLMHLRMQTGRTALNSLVQGYAIAGRESISAFHKYQQLAKAQAAISTAEGAIAAYKAMAGIPYIGPALGAAAAGAIIFYGKQQIDAIDSQQFGSAPSAPTFSANPATGLPTGNQQQPIGLTLIVNGETRRIDDIMRDGVQYLYDQNGSVGGLKVSVERSV